MIAKNRVLFMVTLLVCMSLLLSACAKAPAPESSSEPASESSSASSSMPESSSSEPESSSSEPESSSQSADTPEPASGASSSSSEPPASSSSSSQQESSSSAPESKPEAQSSQAPAPATPPANLGVSAPSLPNDGEYLRDVESEVIDLINQERARLGLNELTYDPNLRSSARIRSAEMYINDYFAHKRPNGDDWSTVLKVDVPVWKAGIKAAENIAALKTQVNYAYIESGDYWYTEWENSSSHYAAMIDPRYTHVGVGVIYVYDGELYHGYATTHFASY